MAAAGLLAVAACKPVAFAGHETDLLREPPPMVDVDTHAHWNDVAAGTYGVFSVGPGLYAYRGRSCHTARVTSIDTARQQQRDEVLLYCAGPDGQFRLDPSAACRPAGGQAITCRMQDGDDVTLRPG